MSEKIFCKHCKFCQYNQVSGYRCKSNPPRNDTFYCPAQLPKPCKNKNSGNDCPEFSPRIWFQIKRKILKGTP